MRRRSERGLLDRLDRAVRVAGGLVGLAAAAALVSFALAVLVAGARMLLA